MGEGKLLSQLKQRLAGETADDVPAGKAPPERERGKNRETPQKSPSRQNDQGGRSPIPEDSRHFLQRIIKPEDRRLRNYVSVQFWKEKRGEYAAMREKEKQDLNVFSVLADGARPSIEYYVLTILSCVIATTGLLQGSTATIIGAMIVAPLMTPILAFSLAVIWGDLPLIRTSILSLAKGALIAVAISAIISYLVPIASFSQEILSRTRPTLFDIIVALGSGIVGAYGNANKRISETLVGIAIAVALMPPLCTIGIGIGKFSMEVAGGAALLFLINLVCISLAGAVVFWIMKIHPFTADAQGVRRRALYQIVLSLVILLSISVPVGLYMWDSYRLATSQEKVRHVITERIPGVRVFAMEMEKAPGGYRLTVTLSGREMPERAAVSAAKAEIVKRCPIVQEVSLTFIESTDL
ncbi:MAG: TIGR00341 family protein [Spirochaetes bacterium]|nr:TIGR00341 family protein [Spirochaetota bacterium]